MAIAAGTFESLELRGVGRSFGGANALVDLDLTVRGTGPVARQIGHSDEIRPDGVRVVTRTLHKQRTGTLVSGTPDVFVTPDVVPDVELVRRTTTTIEVRP